MLMVTDSFPDHLLTRNVAISSNVSLLRCNDCIDYQTVMLCCHLLFGILQCPIVGIHLQILSLQLVLSSCPNQVSLQMLLFHANLENSTALLLQLLVVECLPTLFLA